MIAEIAGDSFILYCLLSALCAFGAAACFAFFFYGTPSDILIAGICGGIGWAVFILCRHVYNDGFSSITVASYAIGAFTVGVSAELSAVIWKRPATVYIVPGLIPLVPGGGMYEMMRAAVDGNLNSALTIGFQTLCVAGAIAVGVAIAAAASHMLHRCF